MPEGLENLFTAAGVPMDPSSDVVATEPEVPQRTAIEEMDEDPELIAEVLRDVEADEPGSQSEEQATNVPEAQSDTNASTASELPLVDEPLRGTADEQTSQ